MLLGSQTALSHFCGMSQTYDKDGVVNAFKALHSDSTSDPTRTGSHPTGPPVVRVPAATRSPHGIRGITDLSGSVLDGHRFTPPQESGASDEELTAMLQRADLQTRHLSMLRDAGQSFLRRYARLAPLREETLLLRDRTNFEWQQCQDYRRFVAEAQETFVNEAAAASELLTEQSYERLRASNHQVIRDHENQDAHAQRTRTMELELSNLEFGMQQKESALAEVVGRIVDLLNMLTLPGLSGPETLIESQQESEPSEAASMELHPLIQHYFDKAGDVKLARDRIIDLELEHGDDVASRTLRSDHEEVVDTSDEEFEKIYLIAHAQAEEAYEAAVRVADLARAVCLHENLNPEDYRRTSAQHDDDAIATSTGGSTPHLPETPSTLGHHGIMQQVQTTTQSKSVLSAGIERAALLELRNPIHQAVDQPFSPPKRTSNVLTERVVNWMETVDDPERNIGANQNLSNVLSGRDKRSVSASLPSQPRPQVHEMPHGKTVPVDESFVESSRQRVGIENHWSQDSAAYTKSRSNLRRSSSESELFTLSMKHNSHQNALDYLEEYRPLHS